MLEYGKAYCDYYTYESIYITKQNLNIQHNLCRKSYDISHINRTIIKVM